MAPDAAQGPESGRSAVQVYTLGRFQVCLQQRPLHFEARAHRKPLELLKVLVAQGGAQVSAELVSEALWPDAEGDQAAASFASTLHRLRRLIGQDAVLLRDRRLTLNEDQIWVDATAFTAALEEAARAVGAADGATAWARLERALELYRGPFLEGEFEPAPLLSARERLHSLFLRHLKALGAHFADDGDLPRAMLLYRRGLEADPLAEELHLALMQAHLALGQAAEGIGVYRRCREMLQAGAGVAPSAAIEEAHQALLQVRPQQAVPPAVPPGAPASTAPPPPPRAPRGASAAGRRWRWPLLGAAAAVLALAAGLTWTVVRPWWSSPQEAGGALPLPEQPSIAVLAFANLSGDSEQDYFSEGISENLITRLAGLTDLFVIARNSSFAYKGGAVDVRRVGRELGVRHVLEGSVLRAGERIRVHAKLVDTRSGLHLWANNYDRDLQDVFKVMDDIALNVVTQLEVKLTLGEHSRLRANGTSNPDALDRQLRGRQQFFRFERDSNQRAREWFEQAVALDPRFSLPLASLGWTHVADTLYGWNPDRAGALAQADALARRALAVDAGNFEAYSLLSRIHALRGQLDEALATSHKAVELAPSDATAKALLSHLLVWAGEPHEAVDVIRSSLRLQPYPTIFQLNFAGDAYHFSGQHAEAAAWYRKFLDRQQRGPLAQLSWQFLIVSLVRLDRMEEARRENRRLLAAHPEFTLDVAERQLRAAPFRDHRFLDRHLADLARAGIPAVPPGAARSLPDEPSIVVLPFENLTGEDGQDYFAKGLSDSLTTELYKLPGLFVIARQTAETYRGQDKTAQQIGRELGVRHVLEGSVQRSGDRIRVNAQLIEAESERHVWAEKYDRELRDLFAVQDEIVRQVATEVGVRLSWGEIMRARGDATANVEAWDLFVLGDQTFLRFTKEDNVKARALFARAIAIDAEFSRPVAMTAWSHLVDYLYRWSDDPARSLRLAEEWGRQALALNEAEPHAHTVLGRILTIQGRHEDGVARARRALELEPGHSVVMASLAFQLVYAGQPREALPLLTKALRLAPYPPEFYLSTAGYAYALTDQHQEAIVMFRRYLARNAHGPAARTMRQWLVASLMELGREADARAEVQAWLKQDPTVTIAALVKQSRRHPFRDHSFLERQVPHLRTAGVPD